MPALERAITFRGMLRRKFGPFGLKDVFTLVNLLSGVVAVRFVQRGEVRSAGYSVIVGYLLGDVLDGPVARMTGTANRFGAEFDSITDHFVHVFVPGIILYTVYQRGHHGDLGLAALALLIAGASIRNARFAASRFDFPLCWCGLPRTISGFAAMSFSLSTLVHRSHGYVVGFFVVAAFSCLNLVPIPYMTHRGRRAMQLYVKVPVIAYLLSAPVTFLVARRYTFDMFLIGIVCFALAGWFPVHPDERREFYAEYRRWADDVADRKRSG